MPFYGSLPTGDRPTPYDAISQLIGAIQGRQQQQQQQQAQFALYQQKQQDQQAQLQEQRQYDAGREQEQRQYDQGQEQQDQVSQQDQAVVDQYNNLGLAQRKALYQHLSPTQQRLTPDPSSVPEEAPAGPKPMSEYERAHLGILSAGQAETAKHNRATEAGGSSGVDPVVVQNGVAAVKAAVARNVDPNVVLDKFKPNKDVYNAVVAELSKPENAAAIEASIKPGQRTAIAEIDPIIEQAKRVAAAYAPYKDKNGLLDRDSMTYAAYMAGQKPPDDSPASELANLQMLRVQAGARLLKGGSRAYPALQMAMKHAGNGLVDTRAQIYAKTMTLLDQLQRVRDSNAGTLGTTQPASAPANSDPLGILK